MARNHSTEFHTSKQDEPVTTELLNKALEVPGLTRKHDVGGGHHYQSDQQSTKITDYKINTREEDLFSSDTIGTEDVTKVMRKAFNMVERFINNMLPKSSRLQAPTIVEDSNETINRNKSQIWFLLL